jgi:hypothetical protein
VVDSTLRVAASPLVLSDNDGDQMEISRVLGEDEGTSPPGTPLDNLGDEGEKAMDISEDGAQGEVDGEKEAEGEDEDVDGEDDEEGEGDKVGEGEGEVAAVQRGAEVEKERTDDEYGGEEGESEVDDEEVEKGEDSSDEGQRKSERLKKKNKKKNQYGTGSGSGRKKKKSRKPRQGGGDAMRSLFNHREFVLPRQLVSDDKKVLAILDKALAETKESLKTESTESEELPTLFSGDRTNVRGFRVVNFLCADPPLEEHGDPHGHSPDDHSWRGWRHSK